jgi:hypothetical protein
MSISFDVWRNIAVELLSGAHSLLGETFLARVR